MRHDKVHAYLHYSIYKALGIETTGRLYIHTHTHLHPPKPVYEQEDVTLVWNPAVHTDREVTANRPDVIIK
jgi:hypothetical protein